MGFNFESGKSKEIIETPEVKVEGEQLSETEETAESFDDCSLNEVQNSKGNEIIVGALENAGENYDDCEAKREGAEGKSPELAEDDDDFNDCGKKPDGQYVVEVTYTAEGEISQEEASAKSREAYNGSDDPEDIQQYKENANENGHFEVHDAEVVERPENSETVKDATEEAQQETAEKAEETDGEETGAEDLENMEDGSKVEASEIDEENLSENISQEVEEKTDIELSDETREQIAEEVTDEIKSESENNEIYAAEAEEIIEKEKTDAVESVDERSEAMDEEIGQKADEIAQQDDLTEEEAKEQISEEVSENTGENLSDDEVDAMAEEKSEAIEETIEEKADEQEAVDAVEETADNLEEEKAERLSEQDERSLQERIDDAFEREDVTASEINSLRDEHSAELQAKLEEKSSTEAELKLKFDEVLSKEKGSDGYRQSLQEYNALQDKKAEFADQIAAMEKQQGLLDKKSIELREAQIQKGSEAVAASAAALAGADMLQERFDQAYYDTKADKTELAGIRDESSSAIKELSAERDSIKQAMDAKMDEISEYVTSNNMNRYDTAHDLRYQRMSAEYNAMKESCDRIGYSIVKLDENNKAITEQLGDEYISMMEMPPASRIPEVNNGTDIPGETNYFVDEVKASEVLSPFKQGNWEQLTIQEQKHAIEQLADYNAEILGVEEKPRIVYYRKDEPSDFGGYSSQQNVIFINEYNLDDAAETADTISHEYRHKYQHERAEKLENERDLAFREGFDNYQSSRNDYAGYLAYRDQLAEVDARAYGQVIRDKIGSSEASYESIVLDEDHESVSPDFSENDPEKGAVFQAAINEIPGEVEDRKIEVKNFKELRDPKEVFEAQEIAEIKEKVAPAYGNGVEIAKKIKDGGFDAYKEHNDLESGHIEKVREKSIEAADVLSGHFAKNNYDGLYSPDIDHKTVEMMAIYHDTGMDANIDGEEFNGELSAKQIRDAHSLQSAIHVLRDRDFIESKAVNADEVALGCLLHSKSNSGVSNLSSVEQWKTAVLNLKQGVDDFNKAYPSEQITFDTSFIMNEDGSFKPEVLAQLRSESLALRIGDANGHDSKSVVSQSGKEIKVDLRNCEIRNCEYSEKTIKKIEQADRSGLLSEVEHLDVYIDDKLLTNENDKTGISRAFSLGEGNFKSLSFELEEGKPAEVIKLENCDAYPLSTQFCIEERIREINTAKIDDDYVPERLAGMSDEQYDKLKSSYADQTAKIDSQIIIYLPNVSDTALKSYKSFAIQMAQKYNIEVKVRQ